MDPVTMAAIGGLASNIVGGFVQNQQQAKLARRQEKFQERMRDTAYQAAVKDMRAAGLNPMLAYSQGGASTPSGAQPNVENILSPGVSSALQIKRLAAELKNINADTAVKRRQEGLVNNQMLAADATNINTRQLTEESKARQRQIDKNTELLRYQIPGAQNEAEVDKALGPMGTRLQRLMRVITPMIGLLR